MKSLNAWTLSLAVTLGLCLFASAAMADSHWVLRRTADHFETEGRASAPAKNSKIELWSAADRVRRDDSRSALILRLDQKKLYLVNHSERVYTAAEVQQKRGRWTMTAAPAIPEQIRQVWQLKAKIEPTGEIRKVGSWQAERHRVVLSNEAGTGGRTQLDWWVAPNLRKEDGALRTLLRLQASFDVSGDAWMTSLLALPGVPVLFEKAEKLPDVEVKTREELESVEEGEAPAGIYDPPAGYRQLDFKVYGETYFFPSPL
jgi:hypothetical protein